MSGRSVRAKRVSKAQSSQAQHRNANQATHENQAKRCGTEFVEICLKTRVSGRESPAKSSNLSRPNKRQAGQVRLVRAKRASQA